MFRAASLLLRASLLCFLAPFSILRPAALLPAPMLMRRALRAPCLRAYAYLIMLLLMHYADIMPMLLCFRCAPLFIISMLRDYYADY